MYVVVAEIGLSKNTYGADIRQSRPMSLPDARTFLRDALAGRHTDFCSPEQDAQVLQVEGADQYLVIEHRRLRPDRLLRLTIGRAVGPGRQRVE